MLAVNITGTWLVSKFVCSRMMIANQKGSLINISSCSAMRGVLPGGLHYVLSKTAVNAMCKVGQNFIIQNNCNLDLMIDDIIMI